MIHFFSFVPTNLSNFIIRATTNHFFLLIFSQMFIGPNFNFALACSLPVSSWLYLQLMFSFEFFLCCFFLLPMKHNLHLTICVHFCKAIVLVLLLCTTCWGDVNTLFTISSYGIRIHHISMPMIPLKSNLVKQ